MKKYIIRLDDAADKMDIEKWERMEQLLNKYNIKPIVGVIPNCKDPEMSEYKKDNEFWEKVHKWQNNKWIIALHGYEHVYCTKDGGINPVNQRSEFAGLSYEEQKEKIIKGYAIFKDKGIIPKIFFSPSHTFDNNTIKALKDNTEIRIISDTIANDIYYKDDLYFIPQQTGKLRNLPIKVITACYHPNTMNDEEFNQLELFLEKNHTSFITLNFDNFTKRKKNLYDKLLSNLYFLKRKVNS